jgi:hypothetical protein
MQWWTCMICVSPFFVRVRLSSIKVSMVGLRMLLLSRSDPLWSEFSPFMLDVLEVVDYPAKSQKCVATWNELRSEASARNSRNWTIRFQEPDGPVLSRLTAVKGVVRLRRGASPPTKWCLNGEKTWTTTTLEVVAAAKRSNWRENEKNRKTKTKVWKV